MIKFLLQTVNGEVTLDFVFELLRSFEYHTWKNNGQSQFDFEFIGLEELRTLKDENWRDCIPIGTLEYVFTFIDIFLGDHKVIKPLNVPVPFKSWAGVEEVLGKDLVSRKGKYYIKSTVEFKAPENGILDPNKINPNIIYQIRRPLTIESEWRVFIRNKQILGVQNYSGDPLRFPDPEIIQEKVINGIMNCEAYSIDFAVYSHESFFGTFYETTIIEVHEFFSCGLYGFSDYNNLPWMFIRAWQSIKKRLES